jgi:Ca2+-binding RTX toxin-like protein
MSFARLVCGVGIGAAAALLGHAEVRAQSPSTCTFNAATATVRVTVDGQATTLSRAGGGAISLNGTPCGGATTANTDLVVFRGGPLQDSVTLRGDFEPGLTPEADAVSEIEVQLQSIQNFTMTAGPGDNLLVGSAGGIDFGGDGDVDVAGASGVFRRVQGGNGDDVLDFSAFGGNVALDGNDGADHLIGGNGANSLGGDGGDDILEGGAGNDRLEGGPGDDTERGGTGNDTFAEGPEPSGADDMLGGTGIDTVDYTRRTDNLTVTLGSGEGDDGEEGEGDDAGADIENARGGSAGDTLVGTSARNLLDGNGGNDDIFGGGNVDTLLGGPGQDFLQGDAGADNMQGEDGNDVLVGDPLARDNFNGGAGADEIVGNTDGRAELVNCGPGTDTVEANDEDNFVDCEL